MNINSISETLNQLKVSTPDNNVQNKASSGASFQSMLDNAIKDVNNQQVEGYQAMQDIASGKVTNLQAAVQQIEEAELSMKLALEVKNKALNAYKEVMRMQI